MKVYFDRKVIFGFFIAFSILSALGISSYLHNRNFIENSQLFINKNKVLYHAEEILNTSLKVETGQRGYVLTGDTVLLSSLENASDTILSHLNILLELYKEDTEQQLLLNELKGIIYKKLDFSKK